MSAPVKVWRRVRTTRDVEHYPYTIPLAPEHFAGAWDYDGPTWDGTEKQRDGGVYAAFGPDGQPTYRGALDMAAYRLEEVSS